MKRQFKIGDEVRLKKGVQWGEKYNGMSMCNRIMEARKITISNLKYLEYGWLEVYVLPYGEYREWTVGIDAIELVKRADKKKRKNKKKSVKKGW